MSTRITELVLTQTSQKKSLRLEYIFGALYKYVQSYGKSVLWERDVVPHKTALALSSVLNSRLKKRE